VIADPVEATGGYRENDIAGLVRLARAAVLSDSGVPRKQIAAFLEPKTGDPGAEGITRQRIKVLVKGSNGLVRTLLPETDQPSDGSSPPPSRCSANALVVVI